MIWMALLLVVSREKSGLISVISEYYTTFLSREVECHLGAHFQLVPLLKEPCQDFISIPVKCLVL